MKKWRIGVLGLHHDHVWPNLEELTALENGEIVAAADPYPALREKFAGLYGRPVYEEYDALLDSEELDAVYVYTSNRLGSELAIEAMNCGLHALVEKPMAANRADADAMLAAAKANGVRLMINWPFAWWYQLQHALKLCLEEKSIGQLWMLKYRAAHEGIVKMGHSTYFADWVENEKLSGGGALVDYCCYGAVLARVLLGVPEAVSGVSGIFFRDDLEVDDNAVITLKYPKAMAIAEASWTQQGKLGSYTPIIYGDIGEMLVEPRLGGRLIRADGEHPKGVEIAVPAPVESMRGASAHFLWAIENLDARLHPLCDPEYCRDGNAIMDAGIASAKGDSRMVAVEAGKK